MPTPYISKNKKTLNIIYNPIYYNKNTLKIEVKNEIKNIFKNLKEAHNKDSDKFLDLLLELDNNNNYNNNFRLLFFYSLFCTYYHAHKYKFKNITFPIKHCYTKDGFVILEKDKLVILDQNGSYKQLLEDISIYFNTDANNIEPITGKILQDLQNINVDVKPD